MKIPYRYLRPLALLGLAVALTGAANPKPTLDLARELAGTKFKDKTYADVDCVQFVLAVVEEKLGLSLAKELRNAIQLAHGWSPKEVQTIAEAGTDPRLDGVVHALTNLSAYGKRVEPAEAQPGDLIQYWMKQSDGTWFGHSGVIASVEDGKAIIYGSHQKQNGIGDSKFKLDLVGPKRRIALVRVD